MNDLNAGVDGHDVAPEVGLVGKTVRGQIVMRKILAEFGVLQNAQARSMALGVLVG